MDKVTVGRGWWHSGSSYSRHMPIMPMGNAQRSRARYRVLRVQVVLADNKWTGMSGPVLARSYCSEYTRWARVELRDQQRAFWMRDWDTVLGTRENATPNLCADMASTRCTVVVIMSKRAARV